MIPQQYQDEFEQIGRLGVLRHIEVGNMHAEKQKYAYEWLDEQEHGRDRAYKAEQLVLQRRADLKSTIALIVAGLALAVSAYAAIFGRH